MHKSDHAAKLCEPNLRLSKSKIAAFEHCPKRLWLQVFRRDLAQFDPETLSRFKAGHHVGEVAREQVPNGVMVEPSPTMQDALDRTQELLAAAQQRPIFEATFQREDVLIRADILHPDGWGGWSLIEVKNSRAVWPYQLRDVATQAWTIRAARVCLSSVVIRHVKRTFSFQAHRNSAVAFIDVDVTGQLKQLEQEQPRIVAAARLLLRSPEPVRLTGPHCTRPFPCEFRHYCSGGEAARSPTAPPPRPSKSTPNA